MRVDKLYRISTSSIEAAVSQVLARLAADSITPVSILVVPTPKKVIIKVHGEYRVPSLNQL